VSTVRLLDRAEDVDSAGDEEWIARVSPRVLPSDEALTLVTDAISRVRLNYVSGHAGEVEYDEIPEYGSGDAELADDIDRSIVATLDD
jgi:hypothetical protein